MNFDKNLTSIHAYICADGYVIKNPKNQKHKYYKIGFRNKNPVLLKDFQNKFEKVFGSKPRLIKGQRCEIGSKKIYELLTKEFGSFYSKEWRILEMDNDLLPFWLRSFFDCESWVYIQSHKNRQIGLDSVNESGINQIRRCLMKLGIKTKKQIKKEGRIFRLLILGKENIFRFKDKIGFLHPEKSQKLNEAIKDYVDYFWNFPTDKEKLNGFLRKFLKKKVRIRRKRFIRIISKEKENLDRLAQILKTMYFVDSLIYERINGLRNIYYELNINKRGEINKLIKNKLIKDIFKNVQRKTQKDRQFNL
ncbi:MAG: hypothetical protein JSW08_00570 [archaeon]|nr:MAG: hypothetical protein JSW08_00570 [archaeon]